MGWTKHLPRPQEEAIRRRIRNGDITSARRVRIVEDGEYSLGESLRVQRDTLDLLGCTDMDRLCTRRVKCDGVQPHCGTCKVYNVSRRRALQLSASDHRS